MAGEDTQTDSKNAATGRGKPSLVLPLLNTVGVLVVLSLLVYTKVLYKKPKITEASERLKISESKKAAGNAGAQDVTPGYVNFEPITVNVSGRKLEAKMPQQGRPGGSLHYVTLGFSLELRNISDEKIIEEIRPLILDQLIQLLGTYHLAELNSAQGRYVLKSELLEWLNPEAKKRLPPDRQNQFEPVVMQIHFTDFTVQ